ncbi:hypothetical protein OIU78_027336 [Salix suchowensis]|nr:hypothetical protein OIU78_027336 [Salix suchowensis]
MVFRPDVIFVLLRKTYKESDLGTVCRMVSRILHKLIEPVAVPETSIAASDVTSVMDETSKSELSNPVPLLDYSSLFGEEFQIPHDHWDSSILSVLDIGAVEEGILHPLLCRKLAESTSEFWSALPLVQALLPALRPSVSSLGDNFDDSFSPWKQTFVQQALSQIVATSSSTLYHPLLHACAGYLSSFSPSHAKAACILIDLCSSVLAPWMAQVIAKVDLAVELLEDLLGTIQGARHSLAQARAALKYIVLALSGHMDDILGKYKEVKHRILFLLEMLEPFIDPAIYAPEEHNSFWRLQKPAVLPSLEFEWRRGSVAPRLCCKECQDNYTLHFRSHHNRAHGSNGARDTTGGASSGIPFLSFRIHYPRQKNESQDLTAGKDCSRALTIFIPASVFGDLSFQRRREILQSLILCPMFLIIAQEHSMIVEQKTIRGFSVISSITLVNPRFLRSWKLAKKLTITSAQCLMYSRCLSSIVLQVQNTQENESEKSSVFKPVDCSWVDWLAKTCMEKQFYSLIPLSISYMPYAGRQQLQSFLAAADSVLHVLGKVTHPTCEGPLLRLSLALIAGACLYSPAEDISLISQDIWRSIETIGLSRTEGKLGGLEKNACEVLCRLRNEGDEAEEVDPDFGSTRESILQVLANLTSVQSCFDMFSKKIDQEAMELEEAEMELEILQKEHAVQESSKDSKEDRNNPWITASVKEDSRLQEIKDRIRSLENFDVNWRRLNLEYDHQGVTFLRPPMAGIFHTPFAKA